MKLATMGWVLGGVVAMGLGMGAEACSSSSQGTTTGGNDGGGTSTSTSGAGSTVAGATCVPLAECCGMLTGTNATTCTGLVTAGNGAMCAAYLVEAQKGGSCTGITTTSSSGATTGASPSSGASTTASVGPSGGSSTTTPTSGGGNTSSSSSGKCENYGLFPETKAGIYCPFTANDGGHTYCDPPQACVEPYANDAGVYPPSTCGTPPVSNATVIECLGPLDCASNSAGKVCCGTGTTEPQAACNDAGVWNKVKSFGGTKCEATCTGFQVCGSSTDCSTAGDTCVPSEAYGNDFGICTSG